MKIHELKILRILLDELSDKASVAGCNDMYLPKKPEFQKFLEELIAKSEYPDDQVTVIGDHYLANDSEVIAYCMKLVEMDIVNAK